VDCEAVAVLYSGVEEVDVWDGGGWGSSGIGGWCCGGDECGMEESAWVLQEEGVSKGWGGDIWGDGAGREEGWMSMGWLASKGCGLYFLGIDHHRFGFMTEIQYLDDHLGTVKQEFNSLYAGTRPLPSPPFTPTIAAIRAAWTTNRDIT
jgi:hypothetical protein